MAKVLSPLFSVKARGQIGKSLVFFPWKSINAVRTYVIPANPNTAGQQAQRTILTDAVDMWHSTAWDPLDLTAWNLWATVFAQAMSGFNAFIKEFIRAILAGGTWKWFADMEWTDGGVGTASVDLDTGDTGVVAKLFLGTSKTFMPTEVSSDGVGATQTFSLSGLIDGVIYYFWIRSGTSINNGRTGIYKVKYAETL